MKKYLAMAVLLSLFSSANAFAKQSEKAHVKSKSTQAKITRNHEKNWRQPSYGRHIETFRCYDSWGHQIHGVFSGKEQYFIELGGGSCYSMNRSRVDLSLLQEFRRYNMNVDNVVFAIDQLKQEFGLRHAYLVRANELSSSRESLRYTLIFKTKHHGYREFRVKQDRWSGDVRAIYEV